METLLIQAIKNGLGHVDVYHDFAPDNAVLPFIVIQRVGGSGRLYISEKPSAQEIRVQVTSWANNRLLAIDLAERVENAVLSLPAAYADGAAVSMFDDDSDLRGMRQDFLIIVS